MLMTCFLFTPRYFPLPQPTSQFKDPSGKDSKYFYILGHGLYLVLLKCGAIFSYTSYTCFFSISVAVFLSRFDGSILASSLSSPAILFYSTATSLFWESQSFGNLQVHSEPSNLSFLKVKEMRRCLNLRRPSTLSSFLVAMECR